MENDILDSLEDLGYADPLVKEGALQQCVAAGSKSPEFTKIVEWLTRELQVLLKLEEQVNAITDPNDFSSFLLELNGFLKEIGCPHKVLTEGPTNQKLQTPESCYTLLDYLCTELQAARMLEVRKSTDSKMKVEMKESPTAGCLREMLIALSLSKPPATVTPKDLFSKVQTKVETIVQEQRKGSSSGDAAGVVGKPLFTGVLTSKQWESLDALQQQMHKEYSIRRDLLLKRLDVTIQSFKWGDRLKKKTDEIVKVYEPKRRGIPAEPNVQVAHVLAAREDLAIIEKMSSARVLQNTQCDVKKVRIGRVPDRGGRPEDQRPPPPEMPSWQKRSDAPRGGGGGRGGSASGGSRVQGNWSNQQSNNVNYQAGWDKPKNNYQQDGYQQQPPLNYQPNYQQANHYQPPQVQVFQHQPQQYQQQQPYQQSYEQAYQQPYQQTMVQNFSSDSRGRGGGRRGRGGPRGGRGAQHSGHY